MPGTKFASSFKSRKGDAAAAGGKEKNTAQQERRDPYEVLAVGKNATDQEIKSAYRKMALKYHPDKNGDDPVLADMFKEVKFSYNILSDPEKRRQFDSSGFEAIEADNQELELDLSSLNTVNTVFAALFCKLGVPIKTTVSATVLEEALNGSVTVRELKLNELFVSKVEKQTAHFYSVQISEKESQHGLVCRVRSSDKSKFKLLYFEQEENGGLSLALQEDGIKTGKVTSAGMFFLGFTVYRFEQNNSMSAAKDADSVFFKKLDGFQPSEINELKPGTHVFAVYGDNFFRSASYSIEVVCAEPFSEEKEKLKDVEARIVSKRAELSKFESEYRQVLAQFTEMTNKYAKEMQTIDELLSERNGIHAAYTTNPPLKKNSSKSKAKTSSPNRSKSNDGDDDVDVDDDGDGEDDGEGKHKKEKKQKEGAKDGLKKKKWFNIHVKLDRKKPC